MSFLNRVAKSYSTGAQTAFAAPWAAFRGSQFSLNGVANGVANATSSAGLSLSVAAFDIEWDSLCANIQTVGVSSATFAGLWQGSQDGTNWVALYSLNAPAVVAVGAAGVTTSWVQSAAGLNCPYPYIRMAIQTFTATGGASDTATISYNFRRRWSV